MKPKIIICLALGLGGILSITFADGPSLPTSTPITNANPSIRLPRLVQVHVPTKLKIERTTDMLSVGTDNRSSLKAISLTIGANMVTGVWSELYVYPVGEARPASANGGSGSADGLDFNLGTHILNTKRDSIPLPGIKYVVEVDLTALEADVPPGQIWGPPTKSCKVLWRQTLKQIVE